MKDKASVRQPGNYVITVEFEIDKAYRDLFREAILANARTSVSSEEGCFVFDVCENENSSKFFLYEVYENSDAFKAHLAATHFIAFDELSKPWVVSKKVSNHQLLSNH